MVKQAVGLLASIAGIGMLSLFVGVVLRLSWTSKTAYPLHPADRHEPAQKGA